MYAIKQTDRISGFQMTAILLNAEYADSGQARL